MSPFDSKQFDVKLEGRAIATWRGPKDDATLTQLLALVRREKWKGDLRISYAGNGGVSNVVFDEMKRITETKEDLPY